MIRIVEREGEECHCPCHGAGRIVVHTMACCQTCPHCHRRIVHAAFWQHVRECSRRRVHRSSE
jgi:hypothetical protein